MLIVCLRKQKKKTKKLKTNFIFCFFVFVFVFCFFVSTGFASPGLYIDLLKLHE